MSDDHRFWRTTRTVDALLIWSGAIGFVVWLVGLLEGWGMTLSLLFALAALPLAFLTVLLFSNRAQVVSYFHSAVAGLNLHPPVSAQSEQVEPAPEPEPAQEAEEEQQPHTAPGLCFCDFHILEDGSIRMGQAANLHDSYPARVPEGDGQVWYFLLLFAIPFLPRLLSVVSLKPNGDRTDHLATSAFFRYTERYCIIRVRELPTPCAVRVIAQGEPISAGGPQ